METVELTVEQKALADRAYKRLLSGRSLRRMKGNKDIIDLTLTSQEKNDGEF